MRGSLIAIKQKRGPRVPGSRISLDVPFMTDVSVDEAEGGHRGVGALKGGHARGTSASAVRAGHQPRPAAEELGVELFPETLAQQVEGERVHTGVGEGQEAGADAGDEVEHGGVHLGVVVGAVQVDDVVGEPAEGKEAHEHQHCFGEALPGFNLKRESHTRRQRDQGTVWDECRETKMQTEKKKTKQNREKDELTKAQKKSSMGERGQEKIQ